MRGRDARRVGAHARGARNGDHEGVLGQGRGEVMGAVARVDEDGVSCFQNCSLVVIVTLKPSVHCRLK